MPNPPKPAERKRRAGNPGKRPIPEPLTIVPVSDGPPPAPRELGNAGRSLWKTVWTEGAAWLAPSDSPLVRLLCRNADELERWEVQVADEGTTYTTRSGVVRTHPGLGEIRALERQMATWLGLLGFTPSDRARLGLAEVRKLTGLAELLQRRRDAIGR